MFKCERCGKSVTKRGYVELFQWHDGHRNYPQLGGALQLRAAHQRCIVERSGTERSDLGTLAVPTCQPEGELTYAVAVERIIRDGIDRWENHLRIKHWYVTSAILGVAC